MEFRAPTPEDADAIVAMLIACDIDEYGAPDFDREALLAEWALVADLERDAILGDSAYGHVLGDDIRAWVDPARRGEGRGTALADALEARMRSRGREFANQQAARANAAARALLEGRGYEHRFAFADLHLPDSAVAALPPAADGVRPYVSGDAAGIRALLGRAFPGATGRLTPLDALLDRGADTSLWFVIDAPDGGLVATVRAELRPRGFLEGYIAAIATDPDHRGRGHAAALLATACRELVARGATGVRLHVRSSNPDALRLYERLGFQGAWRADEYRLRLA